MATPWVDLTSFAPNWRRDGSQDWTEAFRHAIDALLRVPITSSPGVINETRTLYVPPGFYPIRQPLRIYRVQDGAYQPVTLSIVGEATGLQGVMHDSIIAPLFADLPAIIIQSGVAVSLKRLVIVGLNDWGAQYARMNLAPEDEELHLREELTAHLPDPIDPYLVKDFEVRTPLGSTFKVTARDVSSSAPAPAPITATQTGIKRTKSCISVSGPRQVILNSIGIGQTRHCINCVDYAGRDLKDPVKDALSAGHLLLGRVSSVVSATVAMVALDKVTLSFVPLAFHKDLGDDRPVSLFIAYYPRIHPRTIGDVTQDSKSIKNTSTRPLDPSDKPVVTLPLSWIKGHRIIGNGIKIGAHVTSVSADTLEISIAGDKSSTGARLFDADVNGIESDPA